MSLKDHSRNFWRDGYLVIDDFFDAGLMDRLDREIEQHFGDNPEFRHEDEFLTRAKTEVIPWFPQNPDLPEYTDAAAQPFNLLESDQKLSELTSFLLGEKWTTLYSMVMFSGKGTTGQAWHQDCAPENPSRFNLNRLVYSRDLSAEIGGQTVVLPGSHRKGELPVGEPHEDLEGQVVLTPRKGTLVMLHGHTWHRVLPITGGVRFSTNYRSCPQGTPADITDVCVYRNMRYRFSTSKVIEERSATSAIRLRSHL
jgi:ectoine hydroxylase